VISYFIGVTPSGIASSDVAETGAIMMKEKSRMDATMRQAGLFNEIPLDRTSFERRIMVARSSQRRAE
jgi:hypothetical protein